MIYIKINTYIVRCIRFHVILFLIHFRVLFSLFLNFILRCFIFATEAFLFIFSYCFSDLICLIISHNSCHIFLCISARAVISFLSLSNIFSGSGQDVICYIFYYMTILEISLLIWVYYYSYLFLLQTFFSLYKIKIMT